jgi:hypothetical protein
VVKDKLNEKAEFLQMRFSLFFLTIQKCLADTNNLETITLSLSSSQRSINPNSETSYLSNLERLLGLPR